MRLWLELARRALSLWWQSNPTRLAAALAFYSLFSLAPVLVVAVAVAGAVFGEQAARGELVAQVSRLVGPAGAQVIESVLASAGRQPAAEWLSAAGLFVSFLGATAVFAELQDGLNTIWGVRSRRSGLVRILRERLWAFAMVLAMGLLLLASLVAGALLAALLRFFGPSLEHPGLLQVLNLAGSLAGAILVFALIYKFLPETWVAWRDVGAGAVAGALLFVLGQSAIGWYLAGSTLRSVYGAAGSLAVLLVWIYYSAQILYLGAALTCACAQRRLDRAS
jgi:membrane protein